MNQLLANTLIATAGIVRGTLASAFSYLNTLIKSGMNGAMQFHQEGIAFARDMGMNAKEAQAYTEVLTERTERLAMKYGVAAKQVQELQRNISIATSRQLMLNESQAEGFLQLNKLVGSNAVTRFTEEMMSGMGGQLDTVQGAVAKAYATAAKSGLNAQKVSEKIANNLSMANRLSFRTGIDGLTRMAMQAEKVGMSLQTVESVANNFMEIDSAIEHSAMLNMLGGAAGIFGGNPLNMAYEANYDPEALQKRITSMLGGLAQFDSKTGIANVNGVNMDFARNIAKALGMSPDEAVRVAKKQAEVGFKEQKFGAQFDKLGLNPEQRDFLINKSTVRDGQMFYTDIKGKEHNLGTEGITDEVLKEMMKYEGKSDRDIMEENARSLTSINEILTGIKDSIMAMFGKFIEGMFPDAIKDLDNIGEFAKNKLEPIAKNVGVAARGVYDWFKSHQGTIKAIASDVLGFIKFSTEHWKILLTTLGTLKFLKFLGNAGILGRGGSVASSAARSGGNIFKSIWGASKGMATGNTWSYAYGRGNGEGRIMSAIKAPGRAFGMLSGGGKLLTAGGALVGAGFGAYKAITADNAADRGAGIGTAAGTLIGTALGGPIGAAIGGFLGDFAGRFVGEHWGEITDTISKGWDVVVDGATSAWKWFSDGAKSVWEIGKSAFGVIFNFGKWLLDNNPIAWIAEGVGKLFGKDWSPTKIIGDFFRGSEKHAKGGVIGGNSYSGDKVPVLANSGEAVITPQQFNAVFGETPVRPKNSLGEAEYIYKPNRTETSNVNGNTITVKDFNINLSGTLKLDGGSSYKNIDVNELLRDQAFMTSLKNMIKTSINQDINGGRFMNDLATMSGFPSQTSIYAKRTSI